MSQAPIYALAGLAACAAAPPTTTAAPAAAPATAPTAGPASATPITRTLLQHADLPDRPGWETRLYLIEYGPGVAAPLHHHPVIGLGYVLSGSFESAFEGEAPVTVREGSGFIDRAITPHTLFRNLDPARPLRFLMSYAVRKGEPVVETP